MDFLKKYSKYSDLILRLGLGFVFIYFGIDKFFHPSYWIGYIPAWFVIPISMTVFIYLMGIVETVVGLGIVTNRHLRFFAAIAALMLIGISISIGWNEITVRDIGLLAVAVSLMLKK